MPGYMHFTRDPVRDRLCVNVVEKNPNEVKLSEIYTTAEFESRIADGWRNDQVYKRCPSTGQRIFELVDVNALAEAGSTDLAAVEFDPMAAYLHQTGVRQKLAKYIGGMEGSGVVHQAASRFHAVFKSIGFPHQQPRICPPPKSPHLKKFPLPQKSSLLRK